MIKIKEVKCIKTINAHSSDVYSLLLLKDNRIASCSKDGTIRIFNPSNDYNCDQVIEKPNERILSICQTENGTIVSCSYDHSITIGDYIIKDAHDNEIFKVIALPNNRIASCSSDRTIKIWDINPPYSDTPMRVLIGHYKDVCSILYIKERDIMISASGDNSLRLWNMTTYQCVTVIRGVHCLPNALCQLDKDRVIAYSMETFNVVNIDKCIKEKTIKKTILKKISCLLKLTESNAIICGINKGAFLLYDMNTDFYRTTRYNHNDIIYDLLLIDENTFASCSRDKTIKVWKLLKEH